MIASVSEIFCARSCARLEERGGPQSISILQIEVLLHLADTIGDLVKAADLERRIVALETKLQ